MNHSPKFIMSLIEKVDKAIWEEYQNYNNVLFYIQKWHESDNNWENFSIVFKDIKNINLIGTLHNIDGDTLLRIAIDLGVETPYFIPAVPIFRNEIRSSYETAAITFDKAFKLIESDPSLSVSLANSALESIIKHILEDDRITVPYKPTDTLYALTKSVLKAIEYYPDRINIKKDITQIGSGLLSTVQAIEQIRSDKTEAHGKGSNDYIIDNPFYAYFIINSVTTIGLFLLSGYNKIFPTIDEVSRDWDDVPF